MNETNDKKEGLSRLARMIEQGADRVAEFIVQDANDKEGRRVAKDAFISGILSSMSLIRDVPELTMVQVFLACDELVAKSGGVVKPEMVREEEP